MAKKKVEEKKCCFQWYDKKTKSMYECGKPAVYIYQDKHYLCEECSNSAPNNSMLRKIK